MRKILITGAHGFLGRNLTARLRQREDCHLLLLGREASKADWADALGEADVVFHLAGVNRPKDPAEFEIGNHGVAREICSILRSKHRSPTIVFSSSIQAELPNSYGVSKANAEAAFRQFAAETGAEVYIYRLKNLFGKWCRPNYNAVTATFCHNIANDLPISISDPSTEVELTYVDDVVEAFLADMDGSCPAEDARKIRSYSIRLGDLAGRIQAFHEMRTSLTMPNMADWFNRALYATYLSCVPLSQLEQQLHVRSDARGSLAEFIRQDSFGQVFVSRTLPGITRGNHYHHTKTEKFFVVQGDGLIRMRHLEGGPVTEFRVSGSAYQVVNIPPGYTHSISNIGDGEMVTLFWASEVFDPDRPDTYFLSVDFEPVSEPKLMERP